MFEHLAYLFVGGHFSIPHEFLIEGEDDLAVAARLKLILAGKMLADVLMVVYLAIDGKHLPASIACGTV